MQAKYELRALLGERIRVMTPGERAAESARLCERVRSLTANAVGIYLALPDEPDLSPALQTLLERNTRLALAFPRADGSWTFRRVSSLTPVRTGDWNLAYPEPGEEVDTRSLEVILVPGRGFTTSGDRIGRGKGIYDRLLADTPAHKIGVGFGCQLVDALPTGPTDVRMDEVWA